MEIPGADRFLNCVLNRSKRDMVLKILVLLLIVLGTPAYMINGILSFQIGIGEFYLDHYFTVVMFMSAIAAYIIYDIVKSLVQHKERDVEWMSALIEYASFFGKDTEGLSSIRDEIPGLVTRGYLKGAFLLFIAEAVWAIVQATLDMSFFLESEVIIVIEVIDTAFIFVMLSVVCLIVHDRISIIDVLQSRFTAVFSELMDDGNRRLEPMPKAVWRSKPLRHMFLMIATLGFYSIPYSLWTVHQMNLHIKRQWAYERSVLEWMAARDGAISVEKVEKEKRGGVLHNIRRAM